MLKNDFLRALELRAKTNLANPNECDIAMLSKACEDAEEECKNKLVANYIKEDFAYIRLLIYLKIVLSDEEKLLYENTIKAINKAPFKVNDTYKTSSVLVVARKDRF